MSLTLKEKELANIAASVATGCKPCTDYHFNKARETGASDQEIRQAISGALAVRDRAREIMESHGLKRLGIVREADADNDAGATTRVDQLVRIAAAYSVNCTSSLQKHVAAARSLGVTEEEIESVLDAALFIKGEAAHYVGQIVKLKEEKNQLQQLLDELERTQAQLVQSEKMAALGKLVAGVVHELNTPIGALSSASDIFTRSSANIVDIIDRAESLDEVKNDSRFQGSVRAIRDNHPVTHAASERISRIIDGLKGFAHLDEAALQETDVHVDLENTLILLEHELKDRIDVVREFGDLPKVTCNPGDLNQVFANLLTNAAEAIKGTGTITIRTFEKNRNVHVQVIDTGVGIPLEERDTLFVPRIAKKGARVKAGLGLFTSYNIVQRHKGRIEVESEVGRGSTFTVILPRDLAEPAAGPEAEEGAQRCDRLG